MYEQLQTHQFNDLKIQAGIHGAEITGGPEQKTKTDNTIFKEQDAYSDLTDQEKDDLTNKMLNNLKQWSAGKLR